MSLEAVIEENTRVLRELISVMSSAGQMNINSSTVQGDVVAGEKKDADVVDIESARKPKTTAVDKGTSAKPDASYDDAAMAVTTLARTAGRDVAIGVLSKFGVKKLPDVKPEQYAAVIEACEKAGE